MKNEYYKVQEHIRNKYSKGYNITKNVEFLGYPSFKCELDPTSNRSDVVAIRISESGQDLVPIVNGIVVDDFEAATKDQFSNIIFEHEESYIHD